MIRRTYPSLWWFGAVAALLLLPLSVQADGIGPETYVEEELEPEPEVEESVEKEAESVATSDGPSFGSKLVDCTVRRPLGFAATLVGGAFFLPAALLTSPGGMERVEYAYEIFVASPVEHTFKRPLGEF
jgi:hypothetical protein